MTCEKFSDLLDWYLEEKLDALQAAECGEHLKICGDCRLLLEIRKDCLHLDDKAEVPESFSSAWRQAIRKQEGVIQMEEQKQRKRLSFSLQAKRLLAAAACLALIVGGTWMVGQSRPQNAKTAQRAYDTGLPDYYAGAAMDAAPAPEMPMGDAQFESSAKMMAAGGEAAAAKSEEAAMPEKIIRRVNLSLSTRDFDADLARLNAALQHHSGYIEYSDVSSDRGSRRYASLTLRIPKANLDAYLKEVSGIARTVSVSESQEDVSERYSDTQTRLKTQTTKMDRLLDLLSKAIRVEDVLEIEREIADTQYRIDSLTGSLRGMDSKVDYSTVSLYLTEEVVTEAADEPGLGQRIRLALSDAWNISVNLFEDFLIFAVVVLPYLIVIAILALIIRAFIRRKRK